MQLVIILLVSLHNHCTLQIGWDLITGDQYLLITSLSFLSFFSLSFLSFFFSFFSFFFPLTLLIVSIYYQEQSLSLSLSHSPVFFIPLFPFVLSVTLSFTVCFTPRFLFFLYLFILFTLSFYVSRSFS